MKWPRYWHINGFLVASHSASKVARSVDDDDDDDGGDGDDYERSVSG